jgi:hypothetical protein
VLRLHARRAESRATRGIAIGGHRHARLDMRAVLAYESLRLSVSNSLSGGDWELDEVPAVRDPAHMVQIGRDHRVLTGEGQRRVALQ